MIKLNCLLHATAIWACKSEYIVAQTINNKFKRSIYRAYSVGLVNGRLIK